jgi:protein TonB
MGFFVIAAGDRFDNLAALAFRKAFALSLVFHGLLLVGLLCGKTESHSDFQPLAVMEFGDYDPLGGQGGGGSEDVIEPEPEPEPTPPEPEPEPEVMEEEVKVLESVAQDAEEAPPLPPPPTEKPKPQAKPKLKAKPKASAGPTTGESISSGPGPGGPGPGGTPGGTGRGTSNAVAAYRNKIRQRLERNKKYPPASQSRHETGVAVVSFIVLADGKITSPRLEKSSGYKRLDDEAMALLSRVSPLPPFPPEIDLKTMPLSVPLKFSMR